MTKKIITPILYLAVIISAFSFAFLNNNQHRVNSWVKRNILNEKIVSYHEINLQKEISSKSVFDVADSICKEADVPFELVKEIGQNESGWRYISNTNGGSDHGDLQVIEPTFWYWYDKLELSGGKTRRNYLKVAIYYLKDCYDKHGTWQKARFVYGRGHWRTPDTWTDLELQFMGKIDWTKYDGQEAEDVIVMKAANENDQESDDEKTTSQKVLN